jgi:L-fuconolactonase
VRNQQAEPWAKSLKSIAALGNVVCKLSGLATEADWNSWSPADLKIYFQRAIDCFHFDRLMFGGDWPVAALATGYQRWVDTVQELASAATDVERIKLFQTNAERIYRV